MSSKIETRDGRELLALVGKRVLLKNTATYDSGIFEVRVVETSPRGLVNLDYGFNSSWADPSDFWLVEVLGDPLPGVPQNFSFGNVAKAEAILKEWDEKR